MSKSTVNGSHLPSRIGERLVQIVRAHPARKETPPCPPQEEDTLPPTATNTKTCGDPRAFQPCPSPLTCSSFAKRAHHDRRRRQGEARERNPVPTTTAPAHRPPPGAGKEPTGAFFGVVHPRDRPTPPPLPQGPYDRADLRARCRLEPAVVGPSTVPGGKGRGSTGLRTRGTTPTW